jgi:hypothetical protein
MQADLDFTFLGVDAAVVPYNSRAELVQIVKPDFLMIMTRSTYDNAMENYQDHDNDDEEFYNQAIIDTYGKEITFELYDILWVAVKSKRVGPNSYFVSDMEDNQDDYEYFKNLDDDEEYKRSDD